MCCAANGPGLIGDTAARFLRGAKVECQVLREDRCSGPWRSSCRPGDIDYTRYVCICQDPGSTPRCFEARRSCLTTLSASVRRSTGAACATRKAPTVAYSSDNGQSLLHPSLPPSFKLHHASEDCSKLGLRGSIQGGCCLMETQHHFNYTPNGGSCQVADHNCRVLSGRKPNRQCGCSSRQPPPMQGSFNQRH